MGKVIGIDLGTTYSCMSYVDEMGVTKIIDNFEGEQTTPSIVYFDTDGTLVIGSPARSSGAMMPDRMIERVKNYMGSDYSITIDGTDYSPTAISSAILKKLVSDAESALGEEIEYAVITCPAYFGDAARNATKLAGENVILSNGNNLKVRKILDEPTAAAIAYAHSRNEDMHKTVLIYDLGGGTFDCTIMKIDIEGGEPLCEVITTNGDYQLGGKDWDAKLADYVIDEYCNATGFSAEEVKADSQMNAWLSENIEKAKKLLTKRDKTTLTPNYNGTPAPVEITRETFDSLTEEHLSRTILLVNDMLSQKGMTMDNIDEIILVGGSTRMPQVTVKLQAEYNKPISSYEPDKAVAMGAAIMADKLRTVAEVSAETIAESTSVTPGSLSLGIQKKTGVVEKTTKSYGLRYYDSDGKECVLNLVLKDTEKPCMGQTSEHFPLTINGKHDLVSSVEILILENNSIKETVPMDECEMIFKEEPIQFEGQVPGDAEVSVDVFVDENNIVSIKLTHIESGKSYPAVLHRLNEEAISEGVSSISKLTIQ